MTEALERLRASSLLSFSEKLGFKLQSPAGQEWDRERSDIRASSDQISAAVCEALDRLAADIRAPKLQVRAFPGWFSSPTAATRTTSASRTPPPTPSSSSTFAGSRRASGATKSGFAAAPRKISSKSASSG